MEKRKIWIRAFLIILILLLSSSANAFNKLWMASCRIGGSNCLKAIDANDLTLGDGAIVIMNSGGITPETYFYSVYDSGSAESDPTVIAPYTDTGGNHPNYRWHLGTSVNISVGQYLTWGTTTGASGYGIRDNSGTIEFKNSGGSWAGIGSSSAWNNGGKTITNPTTSDDYSHFRAFSASTLSSARMMVVGGTSVAATLMKCTNVLGGCAAISDSLTVNAGAEGTFLAVGGGALAQALAAGDRIQVDITAVTGAVTTVTVDLGGTIP